MPSDIEFPSSERALRDEVVRETANLLQASYDEDDRRYLNLPRLTTPDVLSRFGDGSVDWGAVDCTLQALQEFVVPGQFVSSLQPDCGSLGFEETLKRGIDFLYSILVGYNAILFDATESSERAARAALNVVRRMPEFRTRALWNLFASLKDPAVWDSFVVHGEKRREDLARLDLIPEIDEAIRRRNREHYFSFLRENGFDYAYGYQLKMVRQSYPGWRALVLHDFAHALALGGAAEEAGVESPPTPFLPRLIVEHSACVYQTDIHQETEIGDANFFDHTHRGITTGQTGKIGIGCIIYPCTLGGVTDKVKQRHPSIGNFVLIGTDVGVYGPVRVGDGSVIGANTEINGLVEIGKNVRIRAAVVARTVRTGEKPGRIVFGDEVTVGEESLIINDNPTDLVIPNGTAIPPKSHVINYGDGRPRFL
jgi:serine O-acetyltransferase